MMRPLRDARTALDLIATGQCSPACLLAGDSALSAARCTCPCRGLYHSALIDARVQPVKEPPKRTVRLRRASELAARPLGRTGAIDLGKNRLYWEPSGYGQFDVMTLDAWPGLEGNASRVVVALNQVSILRTMATTRSERVMVGTGFNPDVPSTHASIYCHPVERRQVIDAVMNVVHSFRDPAWQLARRWWDELPALAEGDAWFTDRITPDADDRVAWMCGGWPLEDVMVRDFVMVAEVATRT